MSSIAVTLIVISAFMHAFWNFLSKRRHPSLAFFFITAVSAAIFMSPLLFSFRHNLPLISPTVWLLILATGVAQAIYFFGLAGAYNQGDISLAYPLARALPVLMIAAVSLMIGKGAAIGRLGLAGMVLIAAGCIILPLPRFRLEPSGDSGLENEKGHKLKTSGVLGSLKVVMLMALIAAIGTTGYTLIDDQALRQLRDAPAMQLTNMEVTLLFISLQTISTAVMLGLGTILFRTQRERLGDVLRSRSLIMTGLVTGVVIMVTYGLVLASMAYVTNVSYVAAFRQLSIPIGAILGLTIAREPRYRPKLIGIGIVSVGLVLVGIG